MNDLLPGWRFYVQDVMVTDEWTFTFNQEPSLAPLHFGIIGASQWVSSFFNDIQGRYAFIGRADVTPLTFVQEGVVPEDVTLLNFRYWGIRYDVFANDTPLELLGEFEIPEGFQGVKMASYDISPFAGQEIELRLTGVGGVTFLDSIELIPDPSTLGLAAIAAAVLLIGGWRRFKRAAWSRATPGNGS